MDKGSFTYVEDAATLAWFNKMSALSDPVPDSYKSAYRSLINALKNIKGIDNSVSYFSSLDGLWLGGSFSKNCGLQNLIQASYNGTIHNDYGGSFTINQGLTGNASNFYVTTGYNPFDGGGPYKLTANSACYGLFSLTDELSTAKTDMSALTSSTVGSYLRLSSGTGKFFIPILNATYGAGVDMTAPLTIGQFSVRKSASGVNSKYINGIRVFNTTALTNQSVNVEFTEFARNISGVFDEYSGKTHAYWFAGNSNIDPNILQGIIYKYFFKPLGITFGAKRATFIGDSEIGDNTGGIVTSVSSELATKTLQTLGNTWIGSQLGVSGRGIDCATCTLPALNPANTGGLQEIWPYKNNLLDKDIIVLVIGAADLHNTTIGGASVSASMDTYISNRNAQGFKILEQGVYDIQSTPSGGQTQPGYDADRAALRTLRLAKYPNSSAVTNVYGDGAGNYYIDVQADAVFQNANNLTYYQSDKQHMNATGYDYNATTYMAPSLALF